MTAEFVVQGVTGSIELHADKVVIRRKGWPYGAKSEKGVPLRQIGAVQFKKAGLMLNGYLQIAYSGSKETQGGVFNAAKDENSIVFTAKQAPDFAKMRVLIEERLSAAHAGHGTGPLSTADELTKLASLRDQGVLTADEFAAQKARLLG